MSWDLLRWTVVLWLLGSLFGSMIFAGLGAWGRFKIAYLSGWALIFVSIIYLASGSWGAHGSVSESLAWLLLFVVVMGAPALVVVGLLIALIRWIAENNRSE